MLKPARLFRRLTALISALLVSCLGLPPAEAQTQLNVKKQETGLYRDIFEQNIYYEGTAYLRLDRLYRALTGKKARAHNVNIFEEVPDSAFFVNRHGRQRLSAEEIRRGFRRTDGPSPTGALTVTRGKFEGLHPGFFVRDARGDEYLLKFDAFDYLELSTAAEVIASRLYYAIGYHVPQYTVFIFDPERLEPGEGARVIDESGFKKLLTAEKLEEQTLFLPRDDQGRFRASASKILTGKIKGYFSFYGRRSGDPQDHFKHKDRREIRALQVFSAWLNNVDVRESNTLDVIETENGREVLKHYLIDFNSSLGAAAEGPKPPMFSHEYLVDYGETFKAFLGLGFWKKPWQKRFEAAGRQELSNNSPAVGYFDNKYFHPGKFKTQLPHYAFKDVSRADGFWAAKIIRAFTDADIRAAVEAGELSRREDVNYLVDVLAERRDMIARYWFTKANPLDNFMFAGGTLRFEDLAVQAGFVPREGNLYHFDIIAKENNRGTKMASLQTSEPSLGIRQEWLKQAPMLNILIRTVRGGNSKPSPYVLVELDASGVRGIVRED